MSAAQGRACSTVKTAGCVVVLRIHLKLFKALKQLFLACRHWPSILKHQACVILSGESYCI
jgi:hypothetical protein